MKRKLVSFIAITAMSSLLWTFHIFAADIPKNYVEIPAVLYQMPINVTPHPQAGVIISKRNFSYGWTYYYILNDKEMVLCTPDGETLTYDEVQKHFNPHYIPPEPAKTLEQSNQENRNTTKDTTKIIENNTKPQITETVKNSEKKNTAQSKEIPTQLLTSGDPTLGRLIGDISRGNHPQAPYAASRIIVPRPFQSQFPAISKAKGNSDFTDIHGHWAEKEIKTLAQGGYMAGFSDGTFRPDAPVTYAEFATIVSRFGFQPVRFDSVMQYDLIDVFSNFDRKADYFNALIVADEAGLWGNHVKLGYEVGFMSSHRKPNTIYGSLNAEGNASRQYIALFLANLLEYQESDKTVSLTFTDTATINSNSDGDIINAVKRLVNQDIINDEGTFRPNEDITRAELATMVCRIMDKYHWDTALVSDNLYGNYRQYFWEQDDKLMDLVNEARIAGGVTPVTYHADLQAICEIKMIDKTINGYDSFGSAHNSSYGTVEEMRKLFGFPFRSGENAASALATPKYIGQTLAENAHKGWTESEEHHENYMHSDYVYGGFSLGECYGFQEFACKN